MEPSPHAAESFIYSSKTIQPPVIKEAITVTAGEALGFPSVDKNARGIIPARKGYQNIQRVQSEWSVSTVKECKVNGV